MKAIIYERYGSPEVLQLKEVEMVLPKEDEVLVRICATAVNSGDIRLRKADPFAVRLMFGLIRPKQPILGVVFSGEIEAVGQNVTLFKKGQPVYGTTGMKSGTYAEYKCLPETGVIALKPDSLSFTEAAAIPFGATTALHFLKKANTQPGKKVLIYGASGSVGTAAIQLARYYGADVTGVCSTDNLDMVESLGANKVIDYTKQDFSKNNETYDIIFDTVGKSPFSNCIRSLTPNGRYLRVVHMSLSPVLRGLWIGMSGNKKVIGGGPNEKAEDLNFLNGLIETGRFKPVIDRTYSLEQIVEAHRYVEQGHKKGNVVITI